MKRNSLKVIETKGYFEKKSSRSNKNQGITIENNEIQKKKEDQQKNNRNVLTTVRNVNGITREKKFEK